MFAHVVNRSYNHNGICFVIIYFLHAIIMKVIYIGIREGSFFVTAVVASGIVDSQGEKVKGQSKFRLYWHKTRAFKAWRGKKVLPNNRKTTGP